jgi:hypothetical protein
MGLGWAPRRFTPLSRKEENANQKIYASWFENGPVGWNTLSKRIPPEGDYL